MTLANPNPIFPLVQGLGLLGKAPARTEFIRHNSADPASEALFRWLEEGQLGMSRSEASLTSVPICFVFCAPSLRNALVGALVPSRDKAGRSFPLAAFARVSASEICANFAVLPIAFREFLLSVSRLLKEASNLGLSQVDELLRRLPLPGPREWQFAQDQRATFLAKPSAGWIGSLFNYGGALGPHYAFHTFAKACRQREYQNGHTRLVLVCPLGEQGPLPWLELAGRRLLWESQPPSFVWTEASPPRLLLSIGPRFPASLSYLGRPDSSPMFWPLKTEHPSAMVAARHALSLEQCRAIEDGDVSNDALLSRLAQSGR
jgi:type VI secretion system ImpM family protein